MQYKQYHDLKHEELLVLNMVVENQLNQLIMVDYMYKDKLLNDYRVDYEILW